jgi:hypothetical protein
MEKEVRTKFTTLFLDPIVSKKLAYYTKAAVGEVSGLGTVTKDDKGRWVVNKVFLLEQQSSAADTELKPEAISKLMTDMMKADEDPGLLKFWWHSHADMGVFWSGTDDACAETLSREYAFSLVVNKKGEKRCRLDLYNPFRVTFDGVRVEELIPEDKVLQEECEKEVKEKVKSTHESWKGWDFDKEYGFHDYRGNTRGYDWDKRSNYAGSQKKRITLPETLASDIERLMDLSSRNSHEGGVFCKETWDEYIHDTLKEIAEKRYEKKASCSSFGTFDTNYDDCTGKCKIKKQCAFWTRFLDETEEDAASQLEDLNRDVPPECMAVAGEAE